MREETTEARIFQLDRAIADTDRYLAKLRNERVDLLEPVTRPICGCSTTAVRPHQHSVYCLFYRPYGQAFASVCFEPGDPGYEQACELKRQVSKAEQATP